MNGFEVDSDPRQRWPWNVRFNGKPVARCASKSDALRIESALRLHEENIRLQNELGLLKAKLRALGEQR